VGSGELRVRHNGSLTDDEPIEERNRTAVVTRLHRAPQLQGRFVDRVRARTTIETAGGVGAAHEDHAASRLRERGRLEDTTVEAVEVGEHERTGATGDEPVVGRVAVDEDHRHRVGLGGEDGGDDLERVLDAMEA
jgi:hypothetical protein